MVIGKECFIISRWPQNSSRVCGRRSNASHNDAIACFMMSSFSSFWLLLLTVLCIPYSQEKQQSANIIMFLADDQDLILGGLKPMQKTLNLLANEGTVFANAFVTTPICCPSRSSILTGKYLHNHHTVNNSVSGGCSDHTWQANQENITFAAYLKSVGYKTFYAGKYLNQYGKHSTGGPTHVPIGWDWWVGLVGNSRYYNYTLSVNGSGEHHTSDYLTDVIKEQALNFLGHQTADENFLMVLSPPAPHAPYIPAPQYKDHFKNITALHTPNFNIKVTKDKHWLLRMTPSPLPKSMMPLLDYTYRRRWETLLSVDDMVEAVIKSLKARGMLDNTYLIYTSDHGYHIGQFGLPRDKRQPYEFDIRIPLLIRGPNVPKKRIAAQTVLNIDLAPTLLEMAGLQPPPQMDGQSFLHVLRNPDENNGRMFLVEYKGEGNSATVSPECSLPLDDTLSECTTDAACKCQDSKNNTFTCVRQVSTNRNFLFCRFEDSENFIEAYDLQRDPYQMHNIGYLLGTKSSAFYEKILNHLSYCSSLACRME